MAAPLNRRRFMVKMGQTAGVASGLSLSTLCATPAADQTPDYSRYEDILREKIQWDTKTRGTHLINCTGSCPFFVYSKDGIILREDSYESFLGVGTPSQVYIPVRPAEAAESDQTLVLLATKDKASCELVGEMSEIETEEAMLAFVMKNREALLPTRDVKGLVRFGIDMDDGDRRKLQELGDNLSKDFVVLDEGKSPEWFMVIMFPAGLALGWFLFFGGRKQPQQVQPGQGTPPPMPPQPPAGPPALR